MESQRQKKISALIQKDISTIIQDFFRNKTRANLIISVTKVNVSPDLSISKIYLSVFPSANFSKVIDILNKSKSEIRKKLSSLLKHQLRIIPDILFFTDDSLDYIDKILADPEVSKKYDVKEILDLRGLIIEDFGAKKASDLKK